MNNPMQRFPSNIDSDSAQTIAVAGGQHGSSMAMNLALCLSSMNKRVCVFQSGYKPSQTMLFNTQRSLPTWEDVMAGITSVEKLIQPGPGDVGVIAQSTAVAEYSTLDTQKRQHLLLAFTQLQYDYDYLVIDRAAGFNDATTSFFLGAGSIVLTITPDAGTLADAFSILKGINQRVFQQPVKVIVNVVAGQLEARQIIARLAIAVRKYLGVQCGSLSFFIMDERMLSIISDSSLVMLDYPESVPGQCLKNISQRLAQSGPGEALDFQQPDTKDHGLDVGSVSPQYSRRGNDWMSEAIDSIQSAPVEVIEPIMQKLNKLWQQRTRQIEDKLPKPNSFELEILKLKTAIHFASQVTRPKTEKEK